MIKALEIPVDFNLAPYSRFLHGQGLDHRISEEGLNQVLWVNNEAEATFVRLAFDQYRAGDLPLIEDHASAGSPNVSLRKVFSSFPLTLTLIAINIVLFPVGMGLVEDATGFLFGKMMFLDMQEIDGSLYFVSLAETLGSGEWWRLFTPMFVHFGWLHIVFNLLWVWEIGRRIEFVNGAWWFASAVLLSSIAANVTQYLMSGPGLFGGMSGVGFGLLGHSLVWSRLVPGRSTGVANGIYIFMLVYLVIGFTGAIDLLGLGKLANGAHLGGLLAGLVTGGLAGFLARSRPPQSLD